MSKEDFDTLNPEGEEELITRTQIKNEMTALQKMGEFLVDMSKNQLAHIPLEGELSEAIVLARRLKNREGRRRQIQYIGKLMRDTDLVPIEAALEKVRTQSLRHKQHRENSMKWGARIIEEGSGAIEEFLLQFDNGDRQQIRQLQRSAAKEAKQIQQQEEAGKTKSKPTQANKLQQVLLDTMEHS